MSNQSFIHTFKTNGGNYIYDVNTNTILRIDNDLFGFITNNNKSYVSDSNKSKLHILKSDGYLSSKRIHSIEHESSAFIRSLLDTKLSTLVLQVTKRCNLRCSYCVFSGNYEDRSHVDSDMTFELAKKSIDFFLDRSSESSKINFSFYGGEPLLNIKLIQKCLTYIKQIIPNRKVRFSLTTNGTLLTPKNLKFLVENNFSILISLDGAKKAHDKNRIFANNHAGSFDVIMKNLDYIKLNFPEYMSNIKINAVLDGTTDLEDTLKFFSHSDVLSTIGVRSTFISEDYSKENINITENFSSYFKYEKLKVFLNRLGRVSSKNISELVDEKIKYLQNYFTNIEPCESVRLIEHHSGPCIPGSDKLFITTEGTFFPCEKASESSKVMQIGSITTGFDISNILRILNIGKLTESECKNCWAYRFCSMCAVKADDFSSFSREKKLVNCSKKRREITSSLKDMCMLDELSNLNLPVQDYRFLSQEVLNES